MAVYYRTCGFILKKEDRSESDRLFTIFSEDFGKLEILGKAIRKITSKLRSGAESFYFSEIEFIQGKTHKTLTDAVTINKFENIRSDLEKLEIASRIVQVCDNLVAREERDEKIWQLLAEVFNRLDNCKVENSLEMNKFLAGECGNEQVPRKRVWKLEIIYYYFLWNLLSILGYEINLYHCAVCQKKLEPENLYFNFKEGGIIDSGCYQKIKDGKAILPEVIKILRLFLKKDWNTLLKLKIGDDHRDQLELISEEYFLNYRK